MTTSHQKCSEQSRSFCDALLVELRLHFPDVNRKENREVCSFSREGHTQFAHYYHKTRGEDLGRIYIQEMDVARIPPVAGESFRNRPKIEKGWDKAFPSYMPIPVETPVAGLAERLLEFAVPLSRIKRGNRQSLTNRTNDVAIIDGQPVTILLTKYERVPRLRQQCLDFYGYRCQGCEMLMSDTYGTIAEKLIHVHHKELISSGPKVIDPKGDLVPLCPNCHAVVHLTKEPMALSDLRNLITTMRGKSGS